MSDFVIVCSQRITVAARAHCDSCRKKNHAEEENAEQNVVHKVTRTSDLGVTTNGHLISP